MTIEQFSSILQEFILEQDMVWVPGLGLFKGVLEPATIVDRGYTIAPPYRRLVFSADCPQLTASISLPVLYASKYKLSQEQVDGDIRSVVESIGDQIEKSVIAELPGLGKIIQSGKDGMLFVADLDIDIYPEGFGLESVSLKNRDKSTPLPAVSPKLQDVESGGDARKAAGADKKRKSGMPVGIQILIWLLVLAFVAGVSFFLLAHFAPDVLDTLLYSPQELELLKSGGI